ncbi:endonuclease domain-containing protein [Acinetobacter gyllenbergii]|uniref:endonuclease domain-containing protein n=1 Tax=Acinetobacter gyllenbergii TaxID=134534 RepID=UPI003F55881F
MKLDLQLLEFAKAMRSNATDAEHLMWQLLRAKRFMNLKFRRQHVIAPYIVDFYCHELGLVIELDGSQHGTDDGKEYDAERTKFLEALDLKVVRYWNHDVLSRTDMVLEDLWQKCSQLKMDKNESSYSLCERAEVKVSSNNSSK